MNNLFFPLPSLGGRNPANPCLPNEEVIVSPFSSSEEKLSSPLPPIELVEAMSYYGPIRTKISRKRFRPYSYPSSVPQKKRKLN